MRGWLASIAKALRSLRGTRLLCTDVLRPVLKFIENAFAALRPLREIYPLASIHLPVVKVATPFQPR